MLLSTDHTTHNDVLKALPRRNHSFEWCTSQSKMPTNFLGCELKPWYTV
jgi:hypothetical protein